MTDMPLLTASGYFMTAVIIDYNAFPIVNDVPSCQPTLSFVLIDTRNSIWIYSQVIVCFAYSADLLFRTHHIQFGLLYFGSETNCLAVLRCFQ